MGAFRNGSRQLVERVDDVLRRGEEAELCGGSRAGVAVVGHIDEHPQGGLDGVEYEGRADGIGEIAQWLQQRQVLGAYQVIGGVALHRFDYVGVVGIVKSGGIDAVVVRIGMRVLNRGNGIGECERIEVRGEVAVGVVFGVDHLCCELVGFPSAVGFDIGQRNLEPGKSGEDAPLGVFALPISTN